MLLDPDYMNADVLHYMHYSSDPMSSFELILQAINIKLLSPSILMYEKLHKLKNFIKNVGYIRLTLCVSFNKYLIQNLFFSLLFV